VAAQRTEGSHLSVKTVLATKSARPPSPRRDRPGRISAPLVLALLLGFTTAATARQIDNGANLAAADPTASLPLPKLKTHAPAGFRLYRPGYRLAGQGALVSVQICRLPGWAAAGPQHLRVERLDPSGQLAESHERYLPRLGMRPGNNCTSAALHLDAVPTYGETIKICALSGGASCP
jgi:hypothetical protein